MKTVPTVLTIGHSSHPYERFLALLQGAGVTAVADVRTAPFSRHFPHFDGDTLKSELNRAGIAYSFLGKELGGRPGDSGLYCNGVADYERMATTGGFRKGLDRVLDGARKYRLALMCSEHDPLDCHRCLLVGRALTQHGAIVDHILVTGQIVGHSQIEERLLSMSGREYDDLFAPRDERLTAAYRERSRKVAFAEPWLGPKGRLAAE